jgi:outer membrane protein TolC
MCSPIHICWLAVLCWLGSQAVTPCFGQGSRGLVSFGQATNPASDTLYLDANQDLANQLLSFDEVFKIALTNSPTLRLQDEIITGQRAAYDLNRKQILQNIGASGNYALGNQQIISSGSTLTGNGSALQLSNGYRFGIDARLSLFDVFGRKYQARQLQSAVRAAELQKDVTAQQFRRELIEIYQDMLTTQQVLKIRLLDEQASLAAYRVAEVGLQRGQLTAEAMASATGRYVESKAITEQIKGEFLKRVYVFEALVGVPIQKLRRN